MSALGVDAAITGLLAEGWRQKDVAVELGVSYAQVRRTVKRLGLSQRALSCVKCGSPLVQPVTGRPKKFCSRACLESHHWRERNPVPPPAPCLICGTVVQPTSNRKNRRNGGGLYCSRACSHRASLLNGTSGYAAAKRRTCEKTGCERAHYAKGLCRLHWLSAREFGEIPAGTTCTFPGCARGHWSNGWFKAHDMQARTKGAPVAPIRKRARSVE